MADFSSSDPASDNPDPIISEFADDPEMLDLIQMFIDELPERMAAIEQALTAADFETATTLSHQMKGAAGGYGFPTITDAAAEVEVAARDQDVELTRTKLDIMLQRCARARAS